MNQEKPKYEIIKGDILARIRNNNFSYDEVLCTEKQLSEEYQVSRITAKRAITDLENLGILFRKRGVGSFVARNAVNNLNRSLSPSTKSLKMVSFLLPFDITKGGMLQTVEVINSTLNSNEYIMSIYVSGKKEKANLKLLLSQNLSGLIYYPERDKINLELINEFVFSHIPVVIVDKTTDCSYVHNITSDNFEGGRLLTEHLLSLGHKNIAFLTTAALEDCSTVRNRFGGFLHQMQKSGHPLTPTNLISYGKELTDEDAFTKGSEIQDIILKLYHSNITAIIAENDVVAHRLCLACNSLGIRIPEDLSICGFDKANTMESQGLTSIQQNFHQIGVEVSNILSHAMADPNYSCQKIILPVQLSIGNTTAAPREIS
jgi:sugar-binding transcriptional regulator, gntR family